MTECIALIRGINVGRAKRIAMADLREVVAGLGTRNVRTVLNSGNVIFQAQRPNLSKLALAIEAGIVKRCGFSAAVVVITAADLDAIIVANPLRSAARDHARYLVAFASGPTVLSTAKPLLKEAWAPDALAIGARAAYVWCANGMLESKLLKALTRLTGESVTTRNWATVLKLQAAAADSAGQA